MSERLGGSAHWDVDDAEEMDLSGYSIKNRRIRIQGSFEALTPGTSGWFLRRDPWLAYQLGRNMYQRQWRRRDGAAGFDGRFIGHGIQENERIGNVPFADVNSCAFCHSDVYREPGPGITIPKNSGRGRQTLNNFGLGLMEMIALQNRLRILQIVDPNRDGWISKAEMTGQRVLIEPVPGAQPIDFGANADADGDDEPDLNPVLRIWYVNLDGKVLPRAETLNEVDVAGYAFRNQVFGWGHREGGLGSTIRSIVRDASNTHFSLQLHDPVLADDGNGDGVSGISLLGAQQFTAEGPPDLGHSWTLLGLSADDPDGDGVLEELTQGDADLMEFFLLHAPKPAQIPSPRADRGRALMESMGCMACHVPDWNLEASDPANADIHRRYDGDRRLFELTAAWDVERNELVAQVQHLAQETPDGLRLPRRGERLVTGVFSDFLHHDMGEAFAELSFDGTVQRQFRTPPLWGVAHGAPYGHDGASLSLDDVIRRHGGEAQASRDLFVHAPEADRLDVLAFLQSLVLFQTEELPFDVDGDGAIAAQGFHVAGVETGRERFNPEWLFSTPVQVEGPITNHDGEPIISLAAMNRAQAYGELLEATLDTDTDGFPDMVDPCPEVAGFQDGCRGGGAFRTIWATDFVEGAEPWEFLSAPAQFPVPTAKQDFGALQLTFNGPAEYGGFVSNPQQIHLTEPTLLRLCWIVSATAESAEDLPPFRLRFQRADFRRADSLVITSSTNPAVAPTNRGREYFQYVHLGASDSASYQWAFDVVPEGSAKAGTALRLHSVRLERLGPLLDLHQEDQVLGHDLTTARDAAYWRPGSAPLQFLAPRFETGSNGLTLRMPGRGDGVFGFFTSPPFQLAGALDVPLVLVRPSLRLHSGTAGNDANPPVVRLRLASEDGSLSAEILHLPSADARFWAPDVALMPHRPVYRAERAAEAVSVAVDVLALPGDEVGPDASVSLRALELETYRAVTTRGGVR